MHKFKTILNSDYDKDPFGIKSIKDTKTRRSITKMIENQIKYENSFKKRL